MLFLQVFWNFKFNSLRLHQLNRFAVIFSELQKDFYTPSPFPVSFRWQYFMWGERLSNSSVNFRWQHFIKYCNLKVEWAWGRGTKFILQFWRNWLPWHSSATHLTGTLRYPLVYLSTGNSLQKTTLSYNVLLKIMTPHLLKIYRESQQSPNCIQLVNFLIVNCKSNIHLKRITFWGNTPYRLNYFLVDIIAAVKSTQRDLNSLLNHSSETYL